MISVKNINTQQIFEFNNKTAILSEKDLGTGKVAMNTYKGMEQQGVYITSSSLESRDITLTGYLKGENAAELKRKLDKIINPLEMVEVIINDKYKIEGKPTNTLKVATDSNDNNSRLIKFFVNIFCPNPSFTDYAESKAMIAKWIPVFHFPLIIPKGEGIQMGHREPSLIANVKNYGELEIGMRIVFKAKSTMSNPSLFNINTREFFKVYENMKAGDQIIVNTNYAQKSVILIRDGVTTNIFNKMDLDSTFLRLRQGDNLFRYDADTNLDNLEVDIYYNNQYLGV